MELGLQLRVWELYFPLCPEGVIGMGRVAAAPEELMAREDGNEMWRELRAAGEGSWREQSQERSLLLMSLKSPSSPFTASSEEQK